MFEQKHKKTSEDRKSSERTVKQDDVIRQTLEDQYDVGKLNLCGDVDPNRYYHVFNDEKGKLERMRRRGYKVEDGNKVWLGDMNPTEVGGIAQATAFNDKGTKAVLMSCPKEYKQEDDEYRQKLVDETEKSIYRSEEQYTDQHGEGSRYGKIEKD